MALGLSGCHCADSKVGPLGSAAGDRESVTTTTTTPPSGLQEPSGEPVPNNEVHFKKSCGGGRAEKEIDQRAGEQEREDGPGGCAAARAGGAWAGAVEGRKPKIPSFGRCRSAPPRLRTPTLQPWGLGKPRRQRQQAGKREQHDPTCLREG